MTPNKPELMCPIRDWASLEACKSYADAVYFGTADLSMRANADSITSKDLPRFVKKCHDLKIKAYLTINSVIYNDDLKKAAQLIKKAKQAKVDAVIVWDPAAIELARKLKIPFIISTQANVSNVESAKFYQKLGANRIVVAREMSLKQIQNLKSKVNIEVEAFVHGAVCMAISGRCLLSAYLYGKSANCGSCGQPCRKAWTLEDDEGNKLINHGQYFLSAKDLCMIEYIPELIKAGIDSFKIEGRRRDPKYIETTARCYREAIDAYFTKTYTPEKVAHWKKELSGVYNRGFSTGFYFSKPGKEGINYEKADNSSIVKKTLIGFVTHSYPKINVVSLKLKHRGLKIGEKIIIEGASTFIEQTITSLQKENHDIKQAKKGEDVAIKISGKARINDNVFLLQ
jgi:putative protease